MTAAPSQASAAPAYDRADWASAFRNVGVELDGVELTAARGEIPQELVLSLIHI
jgi:all-trans-8'-apo-beta-carotenal 15,15'-oxygenase